MLLMGFLFFWVLGYLTTYNYLGPDELRLGLIIASAYCYYHTRDHGKPKLTKSHEILRFCESRNSGTRFWDDSPPRSQRKRRRRYPKQYWLRRRIARREPKPEGNFLPWDLAECAAHHNLHLSNPRLLYGPLFDVCLKHIDPTLPVQLMKDNFISTTKV